MNLWFGYSAAILVKSEQFDWLETSAYIQHFLRENVKCRKKSYVVLSLDAEIYFTVNT